MIEHEQYRVIDEHSGALLGRLNRDTVPGLWPLFKAWQPQPLSFEINLSEVERIDSAGMVMIIHLLEHAKKQNCHIMLSFVPTQLSTLLALSNVEKYIAEHIKIN